MSEGRTAYVSNDNLAWIENATRKRDGTLVTSGIVTLTTVRDMQTGAEVPGQTFPAMMFHEGDGTWVGILEDDLALEAGKLYEVVLDMDGGVDVKGHWELIVRAEVRRS